MVLSNEGARSLSISAQCSFLLKNQGSLGFLPTDLLRLLIETRAVQLLLHLTKFLRWRRLISVPVLEWQNFRNLVLVIHTSTVFCFLREIMFYGAVVWDPWLIISQIICLQCLYYLTLGFFLSIFVGSRISRMSLIYFFDFSTITASTVTGWCAIVAFFLSSVAGAGFMLYLIERAKKCLDFSATLYIIHLFICLFYGGWPSSLTWWVVNLTCFALMAFLGEWLCIKRELREIPMTRLRSSFLLMINNFAITVSHDV